MNLPTDYMQTHTYIKNTYTYILAKTLSLKNFISGLIYDLKENAVSYKDSCWEKNKSNLFCHRESGKNIMKKNPFIKDLTN